MLWKFFVILIYSVYCTVILEHNLKEKRTQINEKLKEIRSTILHTSDFISLSPEEQAKVKRENFYNFKNKMKGVGVKEEGTFDVDTKERINYNQGYQVSFETNNDNYTSTQYDEISYRLSLNTDGKAYMGVWGGSIEASFFFRDRNFAKIIASAFNQIASYDWEKDNDINNIYFEKGKKMVYE